MISDGAYVDASFRDVDGEAAIGVVLFSGGWPLASHRKTISIPTSMEAEVAAIWWARYLYPDATIYSDNLTAAADEGATWIPREQNKTAHRVASEAIDVQKLMEKVPKKQRKRRSFVKAWMGRGVIRRTPTAAAALT